MIPTTKINSYAQIYLIEISERRKREETAGQETRNATVIDVWLISKNSVPSHNAIENRQTIGSQKNTLVSVSVEEGSYRLIYLLIMFCTSYTKPCALCNIFLASWRSAISLKNLMMSVKSIPLVKIMSR